MGRNTPRNTSRDTPRDTPGDAPGAVSRRAPTSAAFFDLDKTVIAKSSALAFNRPFYRDGLITTRDVLKGAYAQLIYMLARNDEEQMGRIRDYLAGLCRGWPVEQVRQIVAETLHELINPYIYAEAAELIAEHRAAGRDVVLVSSSGEEMVRPIGALLDVSDVIATRMVVVEGKYTGEVEFYAAGAHKATAVRALAAARGYDLAECHAYSDSATDLPLLECVGKPTAVNPDRVLRRTALERGWPQLTFRHPIPLRTRVLGDHPAAPAKVVILAACVAAVAGAVWYGKHRRAVTKAAKQQAA